MGSNKGGILDQPPPSNLDAELCVIGSVLLLPSCMDEVLGVISEGDFYDDVNRELFSSCVKIHNGGGKLDVATLSAELKARKKWEDVGGAATIAKVARAVPHAAHAE